MARKDIPGGDKRENHEDVPTEDVELTSRFLFFTSIAARMFGQQHLWSRL